MAKTKKYHLAPAQPKKRHPRRRPRHAYGAAIPLNPNQFKKFLAMVTSGQYNAEASLRDEVLVRLSYNCGLRVCEMAGLQWQRNILDADGRVSDVLHITPDIGKRVQERWIAMRPDVVDALKRLHKARQTYATKMKKPEDVYVIHALRKPHRRSERAKELDDGQVHPNSLAQYWIRLYNAADLKGCSSHSGRRTLITTLGRRCNEVGGSIRDVQLIAGHASLETTQGYLAPLTARQQQPLMGRMY